MPSNEQDLQFVELPFTWDIRIPHSGGDGIYEIRDAAETLIADIDPCDQVGDQPENERLAAFVCQACNVHKDLLAVCQAIVDSFDATGEYRYHTAEYSVAQVRALAHAALQKTVSAPQ